MTTDHETPKEADLPEKEADRLADKPQGEESACQRDPLPEDEQGPAPTRSSSDALAEAKREEADIPSLFEQLQDLADDIANGPTALFRRDDVAISRDKHLDFIRQLIAYCQSEAEFGIQTDDALIDRLTSDRHQGEAVYMPMHRVKQRARVILGEANVQAETILSDARMLAARLLEETEEKIKSRYDAAESEINDRLQTSRESSTRSLVEARDELTNSRQKAVDILNRYMDKAEEDYQGYWERAEQTLLAALNKADATYAKVAEVFDREMDAVRQDIETIEGILEELDVNRPR